MNQYLINLTTKTIVGRFANIAEAEVAGEVLLAPEPYDIRDQETLLSYSRDELRALLAGLGLEVKANWPKAQFVEKVVNMADAAEFAPINPPKEPEPEVDPKSDSKAKKSCSGLKWSYPKKDGPVKSMWDLCESMNGQPRKEILEASASIGLNQNMAKTQYSRWKNSRN